MDGNESAWFSVSPVTVINEATISIATKQAADYETTSSIPFKVTYKLKYKFLKRYSLGVACKSQILLFYVMQKLYK